MKKLKVKKQFGIWYYEKINPNIYNDLEFSIYILFDENMKPITEFGSYFDMKYFVMTGVRLD